MLILGVGHTYWWVMTDLQEGSSDLQDFLACSVSIHEALFLALSQLCISNLSLYITIVQTPGS